VRLLLTDGADIDAKDNNGRTALDFAVLHNYTDVAEMLRQRGGLQ
jgi:ankyrin repeat protein